MIERCRDARDLTCTFPGCRVPAQACDLDHLTPYDPRDPDGRTVAENLAPDCRHHHRIKHLPGWSVHRAPNGSILWSTPSGRRYRTIRPVLLPATTDAVSRSTSADPDPPADDLRDLLDQRLRRPVATAPTREHDDEPPY